MTNPMTDPVDATEQSGPDFQVVTDAAPKRRALPSSGARQRPAGGGDTAPKPRRTRAKAKSDGPAKDQGAIPEYVPGKIAEGMTQFYAGIGMMLGMVDPHCGTVIVQNSVSMAASMEKLAKESPAVRGVLEKLITSSVMGEVIMAHLPVVAAIAAHHVPAFRNRMDPGAQDHGNPGTPGTPEQGQAA